MAFAASPVHASAASRRAAGTKEMDDAAANSLNNRVTRLEELPARIDDLTSQISQLRVEMRDEFSAVRTEMAAGFTTVRSELAADIEAKTDSLGVQMRMLHEDVIARIALLQEGRPRPPKGTRKKK